MYFKLLFLPLLLVSAAGAQNPPAMVYAGVQSTVTTTGLKAPAGVAVDNSGNLYIADTGNNRVVKVTPAGVQSTVLSGTVLGKALNAPNSIAVDTTNSMSSGDLYVTDSGNNRVLQVNTKGVASALGSGFSDPSGIAVDDGGNVFIADTGNNRIVMIDNSGTQTTMIASGSANAPGGIALSKPTGLSVRGIYDTLYVADTGNNRVFYGTAGGYSFDYQGTVGSGLSKPAGVVQTTNSYTSSPTLQSAPISNNTYIADTGNGRVLSEFLYTYNYQSSSTQVLASVTTGISAPGGMAADSSGNIYIADPGNNRIVKLATAPAASLGSANIGSTSTVSLTFAFTASTQTYKPWAVTLGTKGLDFETTSAGTCVAKTYSALSNCTVAVSMKPAFAGEREGSLNFMGIGNENFYGFGIYLHGVGIGPQIVYDPGVQTTLASGLSDPRGIAVDGAGNVYVADFGANQIVEVTPAGVQSTYTTLDGPASLAIDGAGNLYAAYTYPNGLENGQEEVLDTGNFFDYPLGVAVDGSGDIFVADLKDNEVLEKTVTGNYPVINGGFTPSAVAVDSAGNLYIVDRDNWLVWKYTPAGNWSTIGAGYNRPQDVAVDQAGNVFVADFGNNQVVKVTPAGVQTTVGTGLSLPSAVAVDGAGNIYITDLVDGRLIKINRSTPPSLSFASTVVGKTSSDSPKEVTVENIGNAALTFPVPSTGKNASLSAGFTLGSATTCPELSTTSSAATLAAGSECSYQVKFTPTTSGKITGSLAMTDNNLNVAKAKQTISLSGTATAASVAVKWTTPAAIKAGTPLSAVQLDATASVPGKFTYSPVAGTKPSRGTVKLTTTFTPTDTSKYKTATASVDLVVK
jgi:sugar lactone lactonase YvrE